MKSLNSADQPALLEAIYEMAAIGADAIAPLRESLLKKAGQDREFARRCHKNIAGAFVTDRRSQ